MINKLIDTAFGDEEDDELKKRWAERFGKDLVQWFQVSSPGAYRIRNNKKLLMNLIRM